MPAKPTPGLHHDYSLFVVNSELLDRVAFRAQPGRVTKVWIQLQDGAQHLFRRLNADRVFTMLESENPDAHYRQLVEWLTPEKALIDLPKRGMSCSSTMRERTYQGHFKDREPATSAAPCLLEF
ncbi:hypothetical protein J7355_17050 [Endozoicomonas sp. G2_2]|uniref:hypothetical protein n=1 Tax=Endozoicomonas sp. G2_2 TaxID=2821092 RepID=UPI001ADCB32E|nr:hypothetical protein [Endozoicomonas sp. G2_2]MBO9471802.1 hypothetical protein [Endozoicomonas sp. G2_2]